tara:strand:+ start:9757 stop:10080 length:324 start_codon:yes stop_codon:yes gene_type:complete
MGRLKKILLAPFKILAFILLGVAEGIVWFFSRTLVQDLLKIIVLLAIVLVVAPITYLSLGYQPQFYPDNYFEFLNTGLLLYLTYRFVLKRNSRKNDSWFIEDEDSNY